MGSRDRFELERLAEELVTREKGHIDPEGKDLEAHDLPDYIPLAHNNPYLTADVYNVEDFLLSRSHTSLLDLRAELRNYLANLKAELVQLINDDYEAFISLSTDLRGEGARLNKIQSPLVVLKREIQESKNELRLIQDAIQDKLEQRSLLREERTLLHLLLKISDSVTRLESLLLISTPDSQAPAQDDITRGNRAKHLSRVATEYTQLLYHMSKARSEKCVFVDEIQWRVERIQSTLSSDLDNLFATTLVSLTEGRVSELEKAKWMADLTECLRTYDVLGLWRDAEDVLRRDLVRGFVKKTIFSGALVSPHSPLVPHTPFQSSTIPTYTSSPTLMPPRTPFTPFTAFPSKQAPFNLGKTTSPYASLLEESDEPLARLYSQILRFVERDLSRIMDIAEKVSLKSVSSSVRPEKPDDPASPHDVTARHDGGFDIMANVVWEDFGRAIMDDLGGIVFAAGRPNDFRKNYEITQTFIRSLEFLAPSAEAIERMRAHPVYSAFERRWQLPVYFQLRWKEIVGKLEEVLAVTRIEPGSNKEGPFVTSQAAAVWTAITACWSAEMYIPELGHRFWKLTLQILSRYKTWLDRCLPPPETAARPTPVTAVGNNDRTPGSPATLSRSATPSISTEASSVETVAAEDATLRQCASVIVDVKAMESSMLALWQEQISVMLPDTIDTTSADDDISFEDAIRQALLSLTSLMSPLSSQVVTILTKRCCDALLPVRSIPSQFRAMSNKRTPTEPSYFVPAILRPVKVFFGVGMGDGVGAALKEEYMKSYSAEIFDSVCQRYVYFIAAMKKTEESLRRLKKGKKSTTFSLFGNATAGKDEEGRDEERIRAQMILDVKAFAREAQTLGVDPQKNEAFRSLEEMVHTTDTVEGS